MQGYPARVRTLLRIVYVVALAAVAGFVLARYGLPANQTSAPPPLSQRASTASFTVSYPSDWRALAMAAPSASELLLAPTQTKNASLRLGVVQEASAGALPAALQAGVTKLSTPQVVILGGATFNRYLNLVPRSGDVTEAIYLLPTTRGTVTGVCSAQRQVMAFTSSCERVLATLRVRAGSALSLTTDLAYALKLNRILTQLNATRKSYGPGLVNPDNKARAGAAGRLAAANARAARAVGHMTGAPVSVANRNLAGALRAEAAAYGALSRAAGANDVGGYASAQAAIGRADSRLDSAYAQLRRLGYRVG